MFASEINARAAKLTAEQRARSEREREKREKERILKERARQRRLQNEEEQRQKRLEMLEVERREEERIAEQTLRNNGVYFSTQLTALPLDESVAAAKGIKRAKDKVVLPGTVREALLVQDAMRNGPLTFELRAPGGALTHAAVLNFGAPDGCVLVPRKVADCLFGHGVEPSGRVTVTYALLPKGTFVRLQPQARGFHESLGEQVEQCLESSLVAYATLSVGDWLEVEGAGRRWRLRVTDLQPEPQVSIVDTDVEADVGPSMEYEELERLRQEQEQREAARLAELAAELEQAEFDAAHARQLSEARAAEAASEAVAWRHKLQAEASARLPPEPVAGSEEPTASCLFRLPDGTRCTRRFLVSSPVSLLFDFVDSQGGGGLKPCTYRLVCQFPRRALDVHSQASLAEAGLEQGQAVFFAEAMD